MKKSFALLLLMVLNISAYAQKSYVNILVEVGYCISVSGDFPSNIKKYYDNSMSIGELLNLLSKQGFEVEFMSGLSTNSTGRICYLLSKNGSGHANSNAMVRADDDSDVYEVARYNLQGMPVSENVKGVQIVVYSNYTTKTIIRE